MKIEKIQKLKNNKYKIKLDSGDIINTYDDVILNNSLLFNKEIDLELLNKINNETLYYDCYNKTLKFIDKKLRSEKEVKEYLKKYLKTILYTFFTFIVGKTFEHLDMWVDLFFVSIWTLVDEKENINIENKKET